VKRLITRTAMVAGIAATLFATLVLGQDSPTLRVKIPFEFKAGGKSFQAGSYVIKKAAAGGMINFSPSDGKGGASLVIITSIARSSEADDHLLAFDKVNGERILSEVWLPGQEGAVVYADKGEHKHELVRLVSKAKSSR
jgi:hypothetical protein